MAKRIIDGNRYMTLATADGEGRPWVTPFYFSTEEHQRMFWISLPDAQHSLNLAIRPKVSIVVFDLQVLIGRAEAVYMRARAQEMSEPTLEQCAVAFRARFEESGRSPQMSSALRRSFVCIEPPRPSNGY